jgi:hypothetical protein
MLCIIQSTRNKDIRMKVHNLLIIATLLSTSAFADDNQPLLDRLGAYKQHYQQASEDANLSRNALETHQIELKSSQSKLQSLKKERDNERTRLDDLREAEEKMPSIDFTDQINRQSDTVSKAGKKYQAQLEHVKATEEKVNDDKTRYAIAVEQEKNIKKSIDSIHEQLASAELQKRLQGINQSKQISVETRETCSVEITPRTCRDQAKTKAERLAAEKGSVVMVESVTEIKNFNMTKDEIKSRVKVRLSNIQVTHDSYDLTADKTGWTVDYAITATVTPVITEEMRKDMKAQIIAEISGGWNADAPTASEPEQKFMQEKPDQETPRYSEETKPFTQPINNEAANRVIPERNTPPPEQPKTKQRSFSSF